MSAVVVIGGGVEGLTAAVRAARSGHQVTLCEQRPELGGLAAGSEFAPGFRHVGRWQEADRFPAQLARELGLEVQFRKAPPVVVPREGASPLRLHADRVEGADEGAFAALAGFFQRVRPAVAAIVDAPAPAVLGEPDWWGLGKTGFAVRRLGRSTLQELLRVGAQPVGDWLAETLTDPALRGALAWEAVVGAWAGPRSPMTAANLLLARCTAGDEVVGGPAALAHALALAAQRAGVTLRVSAPVMAIEAEPSGVRGVSLGDGSQLAADAVISTVGPRRTLLELLDPWLLPGGVEDELRRVRTRGVLGKLHLALSAAPRFTGVEGLPERVRLVGHPDDIERAFDDAKYERPPSSPPPLDLRFPTVSDPSLAPAGQHVASILLHGLAPHPPEGWSVAEREAAVARALDTLEAAAPGARALVIAHELFTPADAQDGFGLSGGHWLHGELALDQLWSLRPSPSTARLASGVPGLWLAGPGTHPGLPLSGRSGARAAERLPR